VLVDVLFAAGVLTIVGILGFVSRRRRNPAAAAAGEPRARHDPNHPATPEFAARILDGTDLAVMVTNWRGMIEGVNDAFTAVTGYTAEEAFGKNPRLLKSGRHDAAFYREMWRALKEAGAWQGEIYNRRKNGEVYPQWLTINVINDTRGIPTHYVGIFSDIKSVKASDERIVHMAFHDQLTGLPNRPLFLDRLQHAVSRAQRSGCPMAVMIADLDGFKEVNDSLGHPIGDLLLKIVAERLSNQLRDADTVARIGGDEFAIILDGIAEPRNADVKARALVEAQVMPVRLSGKPLTVTVSLGVALYPTHGEDAETLIANADRAMYRVKLGGKNGYAIYRSERPPPLSPRRLHSARPV